MNQVSGLVAYAPSQYHSYSHIFVGLNYFSGHRFRSHVLVEFGKPIVVSDEWTEKYSKDKRETCNELLKTVETRLKGVRIEYGKGAQDVQWELQS